MCVRDRDYIDSLQFVQKERGKLIIKIIPKGNYTQEIGERIIADIELKWPGLFDYEINIVSEISKGRSTKVNSIVVEF